MDDNILQYLLDDVFRFWPGPMDELERARWSRVLRPKTAPPLSPGLVELVLGELRADPRFASARPSVGDFALAYTHHLTAPAN